MMIQEDYHVVEPNGGHVEGEPTAYNECSSPDSPESGRSIELVSSLPSTPTNVPNSPTAATSFTASPLNLALCSPSRRADLLSLSYASQRSSPTIMEESRLSDYVDDDNDILSPLNEGGSFALAYYIETWSKIRDISDSINKAAQECLVGRGYNTDIPRLESDTYELLKALKKASSNNGFAEERSDTKQKLPPPLVRPRRHRRKKNIIDTSIDEDDNEYPEKAHKRKSPISTDLYCHSCGTTDTPEWRRGPDGCKSLCNACGLHYAKILKRETMVPNRQTQKNTMSMNNLLN